MFIIARIKQSIAFSYLHTPVSYSTGSALKANKSVERLRIANNDIGASGAKAIGTGLAANDTMKYVVLPHH